MPVASRQRIAEQLGKYGCYFLSIIRAAEIILMRRIDAIAIYEEVVKNGWLQPNCFVNAPEKILGYLVGKQYKVEHKLAGYKPAEGAITILRYEYSPEPMTTLGHFVLAEPNGVDVAYDPYNPSQTVTKGKLISKRVFTEI